MADQKPLVIIDGVWQQIPDDDTLAVEAVKITPATTVPYSSGQLKWGATDSSIVMDTDETDLSVPISPSTFKVQNASGVTIYRGDVVYPTGASGDNPAVDLADASNFDKSRPIGVIRSVYINNGAVGYVTLLGKLGDFNTSSFSAGDKLYLSDTPGGYTSSRPAYPIYPVRVGVVNISHATDGVITVDSGPEDHINQDLFAGASPKFNIAYTKKELTAGENLADGDLCYLKSDGKMWKTSRSATATIAGFLAICTETIAADADGEFIYNGVYTTTGLTIGDTLFIHTTAGEWTGTKPSTTGNLVRIIGYALSTTELDFNPDGLYFEVG